MTQFTALSFSIILFLFGLSIGSFLNVVALRYRGAGRLFSFKKKRSHCPYCDKALAWYELIPLLSFVIQFGRCHHCDQRLSWQYPLGELLGGLVLLLPVYFYNYYDIFHRALVGEIIWPYYVLIAVWTLAALAMLLLTLIDWHLKIIPDQINLFLLSLGIVGAVILSGTSVASGVERSHNLSFLENYAEIFGGPSSIWLNHLMAAAVGLLFFGFIIVASRGRAMGVGDLKLAGALGLLLGWPDIILTIASSFVVGSLWGIYLLIFKSKTLKSTVPFGPFLVIGVFITIFFGHDLASWYFSLML
ncbi:MAG: prepilin peptidase [Patescibacteria group bacterium]